jgi:ATP-dependent Clp protease adaptor protein ClpS
VPNSSASALLGKQIIEWTSATGGCSGRLSASGICKIPAGSDLHAGTARVHSPAIVSITGSQALPKEDTRTELALEGVWRVVVLNDPVNLMSYVVMVFKKVFGFDEQTARQKMLEVHEQGRSIVWSGLREKAEAYVFTSQQWHLTAVLEPDEAH